MTYTTDQCDALLELSNIGTGNAANSLSALLGRPVDISVPRAVIVPVEEVVGAVGHPETPVFAVGLPLAGDLPGTMLVVFADDHARTLSALLGVAGDPEMESSMLCEIGNICSASYTGAISSLTGLTLEPGAPAIERGELGGVVTAALVPTAATSGEVLLLLDSVMHVEGETCSMSFVLAPSGPESLMPLMRAIGLA